MNDADTSTGTDPVSTITMDDGKVNVFSIPMLHALHRASTRRKRKTVCCPPVGRAASRRGSTSRRCRGAPQTPSTLLRSGARWPGASFLPRPGRRRLSGHTFPAGAFLLMAADATAPAPTGLSALGLNEVRIGLTLPWFAIALARYRLTPAPFDHSAVTGDPVRSPLRP